VRVYIYMTRVACATVVRRVAVEAERSTPSIGISDHAEHKACHRGSNRAASSLIDRSNQPSMCSFGAFLWHVPSAFGVFFYRPIEPTVGVLLRRVPSARCSFRVWCGCFVCPPHPSC
jgi:hypothetical protein